MTDAVSTHFDPNCRRCPRLATYLDRSRHENPDYFGKPVPAFGDAAPWLLIVGLAPGLHGANRTGRPFTGDYAGVLLYATLHQLGLSSQPASESADDALRLHGVRISNAVKCAPPANKPSTEEIRTCNAFLRNELAALTSVTVVLALGRIAHEATLRALDLAPRGFVFGHAAEHRLDPRRRLIDSYHCSRYNTQTRRLTPAMFESMMRRAVELGKT